MKVHEAESPSSRRAWIEIPCPDLRRNESAVASALGALRKVALLAEGVDRNVQRRTKLWERSSRPPRGGRG